MKLLGLRPGVVRRVALRRADSATDLRELAGDASCSKPRRDHRPEREAMQHAFDLVFSEGSAQLAREAEFALAEHLENIASETEARGTL